MLNSCVNPLLPFLNFLIKLPMPVMQIRGQRSAYKKSRNRCVKASRAVLQATVARERQQRSRRRAGRTRFPSSSPTLLKNILLLLTPSLDIYKVLNFKPNDLSVLNLNIFKHRTNNLQVASTRRRKQTNNCFVIGLEIVQIENLCVLIVKLKYLILIFELKLICLLN